MALTWKWDSKMGEAIIHDESQDKDFVKNLYEGNAFLIIMSEWTEGDQDLYSVYSFFADESHAKNCLGLTKNFKNVTVHKCNTLIVDYCSKVGANVLLRGIRNTNDFSYEFDLSLVNRSLNSRVETLFVPTEQRYFLIRSSSIKELARFGGDISGMVPPNVAEAIRAKYKR